MLIFKRMLVGLSSLLMTVTVFANPVLDGSNGMSGISSIQQTSNSTVVNQSSQQAIINWQSFNIGVNESTHFQQPAGGIVLNRINPSAGVSQIYGQLTATGHVILSNPAGVYFGPSAYVNVGGLIATTASISDQNFLNKNYVFTQSPDYSGSVINAGQIIARDHGLIALIGTGVDNRGLIQANLGKVVLASGEAFTMNFSGDQLINFSVNSKATRAGRDENGNPLTNGVRNTGSLIANGGSVLVTAKAAQGVLDNVINLKGIVQARSIGQQNGEIIISGDTNAGIVNVAANIDASGKQAGEQGGTVNITGYNILLASPTTIDVSGDNGGGTIHIGGNYRGAGPLPNANATVMASDVALNADAITSGNGGNIILWSDYYTSAHGMISAKANNGSGGFIETSSKGVLDIAGIKVNVSSLDSNLVGTWLLDPYNITISAAATSNGSFGGGNPNTFTPSGTGSNILNTDLQTNLAAANVIVNTSGGGGAEAGNITVSAPITWSSGNSLTLTADGNILLNSAINGGSTGDLILNAGGSLAVNTNLTVGALNATTATGQTYGFFNAISIGRDSTLTNTTSGDINFTFGATINGPTNLTINNTGRNISFQGDIGGVTPLTSLTTNASATVIQNNITTTGGQTYNSTMDLDNLITLSGSAITFNSAIATGTTVLVRSGANPTLSADDIYINGVIQEAGGGTLDFMGTGGNSSLTLLNTFSTADSTPYTFTFSGADSGTYADSFGFKISGTFTNLQNITLGVVDGGGIIPSKNTFIINGGSISGTIDGGNNTGNSIDGDPTIPATWTITGAKAGNTSVIGGFANIDTFTSVIGNETLDFTVPYTFDTGAQTAVVGGSTLTFINFNFTPPTPPVPPTPPAPEPTPTPTPEPSVSINTPISQAIASGNQPPEQPASSNNTTTVEEGSVIPAVVQENVNELVQQATQEFDTNISTVKINPFCTSA